MYNGKIILNKEVKFIFKILVFFYVLNTILSGDISFKTKNLNILYIQNFAIFEYYYISKKR